MGNRDLPRGKCGRDMLPTIHPLLVPWVKKERGYISSPPIQSQLVTSALKIEIASSSKMLASTNQFKWQFNPKEHHQV
jgi:hypothetical protein